MKRSILIVILLIVGYGTTTAQSIKKDSLSITGAVDKIYNMILQGLDNFHIQGSHPATNEVRQRWNHVEIGRASCRERV